MTVFHPSVMYLQCKCKSKVQLVVKFPTHLLTPLYCRCGRVYVLVKEDNGEIGFVESK